jgi:ABC-type branched-subunit amino acid transport system ATPase component
MDKRDPEIIEEMAANAREYPVDGNVVIETSDLRKSFGSLLVLDGTDIKIAEGETRVVIGRSGCGKSVFLKHVIGLLKPDAGKGEIRDGLPEFGPFRLAVGRLQRRFLPLRILGSIQVRDRRPGE